MITEQQSSFALSEYTVQNNTSYFLCYSYIITITILQYHHLRFEILSAFDLIVDVHTFLMD